MINCSTRLCPLCNGESIATTFPYATQYNEIHFKYLKCDSCSSVFVDPVPDAATFSRMYAKEVYHDQFYSKKKSRSYEEAAHLLRQHLPVGASVLDYGCGFGAFLKAIKAEGFVSTGVEFDSDAALFASENTGCEVLTVEDFSTQSESLSFHAIHLGDVLEHLPDPAGTLKSLLTFLKPGGVLFVEGPLEINPSPVYWSARLFGAVKNTLRPSFMANHPPTHLFFTNAKQQLAFFNRVEPKLELLYWQIGETGWPYDKGGVIKRMIASFAKSLEGKKFLQTTFGNRFYGVFLLDERLNK